MDMDMSPISEHSLCMPILAVLYGFPNILAIYDAIINKIA